MKLCYLLHNAHMFVNFSPIPLMRVITASFKTWIYLFQGNTHFLPQKKISFLIGHFLTNYQKITGQVCYILTAPHNAGLWVIKINSLPLKEKGSCVAIRLKIKQPKDMFRRNNMFLKTFLNVNSSEMLHAVVTQVFRREGVDLSAFTHLSNPAKYPIFPVGTQTLWFDCSIGDL